MPTSLPIVYRKRWKEINILNSDYEKKSYFVIFRSTSPEMMNVGKTNGK